MDLYSNTLGRIGLLNREAEDQHGYAQPVKTVLEALCNSRSCGTTHDHFSTKNGVKKNVSRSAIHCPDCGLALFWRRRPVEKREATA